MKLKYKHGGETHAIPFSTDKPTGKRLAVRHNNRTYYASLVSTNDSLASDLHIVFGGGTYALSAGETPVEIVESFDFGAADSPTSATAVTLLGNYGDFGVIADSSQPEGYNVTLTNGSEYYTSLQAITVTQPNSTIIGNDNANDITITGGDENLVRGGLGDDTIHFDSSGGVIVDFGVGVNLSGAGITFAASTSQQSTSSYYAYDRFDTGSYKNGTDSLIITGTVSGFYYDTTSSTNRKMPVMDCVVTYADANANEHVILLRNITKKASTKSSTKPASRVWAYHSTTANNIRTKLYQRPDTSTTPSTLSSADFTALTKDLTDFPVALRPKLINLYNIYNRSGYTNSRINDGAYTQVLPDWIPTQGGTA